MLMLSRVSSHNVRILLSMSKAVLCPGNTMGIYRQENNSDSIMARNRLILGGNNSCLTAVRNLSTSAVYYVKITPEDVLESLSPEEKDQIEKIKTYYSYVRSIYPDKDFPESLPDSYLLDMLNVSSSRQMEKVILKFANKLKLQKLKAQEKHGKTDTKSLPKRPFALPVYNKHKKKMHRLYSIALAKILGHPVIFDFSHFDTRDFNFLKNVLHLIIQMTQTRMDYPPLHVVFCNVSELLRERFIYCFECNNDVEYYATVTSKSYLDLYPKEDLVLMTNHCVSGVAPTITSYQPRFIYVFGVNQTHDQMKEKALREGIKFAQFPMHLYNGPRLRKNSLHFGAALWILSDLHESRDWAKSMQVIKEAYWPERDKNVVGKQSSCLTE